MPEHDPQVGQAERSMAATSASLTGAGRIVQSASP
jgi:hypothetical protein